jgi:hypothetical protein
MFVQIQDRASCVTRLTLCKYVSNASLELATGRTVKPSSHVYRSVHNIRFLCDKQSLILPIASVLATAVPLIIAISARKTFARLRTCNCLRDDTNLDVILM